MLKVDLSSGESRTQGGHLCERYRGQIKDTRRRRVFDQTAVLISLDSLNNNHQSLGHELTGAPAWSHHAP